MGEQQPSFDIPLCGRDEELKRLRTILDLGPERSASDSSPKASKILIVRGQSGCGKTALVTAFREQVRANRGFFLLGKCDESAVDHPFGALADALNDLVSQALLEREQKGTEEEEWDLWSDLTNEGLTVRQINSLAQICPRVWEFDVSNQRATEARTSKYEEETLLSVRRARYSSKWSPQQLRLAACALFRVVARKKTVVLIQDDVQWMREDCWSVVRAVVADALEDPKSNLRFIAICRPQPGLVVVRDLIDLWSAADGSDSNRQEAPSPVVEIHLQCLDAVGVAEVAAAVTRRESTEDCMELAKVLHQKTGGNAVYLIQLLRSLVHKQLIFYDASNSRFDWVPEQIAHAVDQTAAEVIVEELSRLSGALKVALGVAANIGPSRFDCRILGLILDAASADGVDFGEEYCDSSKLDQLLDHAATRGLLEAIGHNQFKFAHDRIRESAKLLIRECADDAEIGASLGKALRQIASGDRGDIDEGESRSLLLLAVRHLNSAATSLKDDAETLDLVQLNVQAAEIAFSGVALYPATEYLETGRKLLERIGGWADHYDLALKVSTFLVQVFFSSGELVKCIETAREVIERTKSLIDTVPVLQYEIFSLYQLQRSKEAQTVAARVLRKLGFPFPQSKRAVRFSMFKNVVKFKQQASSLTCDRLWKLPTSEDPKVIAAMELYWTLNLMAVSHSDVTTQRLASLYSIHMTLKYGLTPRAPMAVMVSAVVLANMGDYDAADRVGRVALEMAEGADPLTAAIVLIGVCFYCSSWKQPVTNTLDLCVKAKRMVLDTGNVPYVFFSFLCYTLTYQTSGLSLEPLAQDVVKMDELLKELRLFHYVELFEPVAQYTLNLLGRNENPEVLSGEIMEDQEECLKTYAQNNNSRAIWSSHNFLLFLGYIFNDLDLALLSSRKLQQLKTMSLASPLLYYRILFQGLTAYGCARRSQSCTSAVATAGFLREGKNSLAQLKRMTDKGCRNASHLRMLLEAEDLCVRKPRNFKEVQRAYDNAIGASARQGATQIQAIGNELAGAYFYQLGDAVWAGDYLERSWYLYSAWGAVAKARQLKERYPDLLASLSEEHSQGQHKGASIKAVERFRDLSLATNSTRGDPSTLSNRTEGRQSSMSSV